MTELEKRAEEYCKHLRFTFETDLVRKIVRMFVKDAIIDFTEQETKLLSQHIIELQRTNGSLTDRVNEAKEIIKEWQKKVCKELSDGCCPSCEYCHYGEIKARAEQFLKGE